MKLRLILGDQLSLSLSSLTDATKEDLILMCEVRQEATYVKHHKKKIVFVFSAMRHFAQTLVTQGFNVQYVKYDDPGSTGSLRGEVARLMGVNDISEVIVTAPGEYRLLAEMQQWSDALKIPVTIRPEDRFLCTSDEFGAWAKGRKQLRMEHFYREMRRKHAVLMSDDGPIGGQWNYDADNRKSPPQNPKVPDPFYADVDDITQEVIALVAEHLSDHFRNI